MANLQIYACVISFYERIVPQCSPQALFPCRMRHALASGPLRATSHKKADMPLIRIRLVFKQLETTRNTQYEPCVNPPTCHLSME